MIIELLLFGTLCFLYITRHPLGNTTLVQLLALLFLIYLILIDKSMLNEEETVIATFPEDTQLENKQMDVSPTIETLTPDIDISDKFYEASGAASRTQSNPGVRNFWENMVGSSLGSVTPSLNHAPCRRSYNSFNKYQMHD